MNGMVNVGGSSTATYAWLKTPMVDGEKDSANAKYTVSASPAAYPEDDVKGNHYYEKLPISINVPNGVIKEYYAATEDINARTFVEFVGENIRVGSKANIGTSSYFAGQNISVIGLTDAKAILIYGESDSIYGTIINISDGIITTGETTVIYTNSDDTRLYQYVTATALSETKVIIVTRYSSVVDLGGIIIDIDDETITAGTITKIQGMSSYSTDCTVTKLTENKALIIHTGSSSYLNGTVVSVEGTTINPGRVSTIRDKEYIIENHAVAVLTENLVFVAHYDDEDDMYMYGSLLSINGTAITVADSAHIAYSKVSGDIATVSLDENRILLAYGINSSKYSLVMNIITIDGTTISSISDKISLYNAALSSYLYTGKNIALAKIDNNKVLLVNSRTSDYYTSADLLYISNSTITSLGEIDINSTGTAKMLTSAVLHTTPDTTVLVGFNTGSVGALTVMVSPEKIKASESVIEGVTKTNATTSSAGKVFLLE